MLYEKLEQFVSMCEPNKSDADLNTLFRYAFQDKTHPLHDYALAVNEVADDPIDAFRVCWRVAEKNLKDNMD